MSRASTVPDRTPVVVGGQASERRRRRVRRAVSRRPRGPRRCFCDGDARIPLGVLAPSSTPSLAFGSSRSRSPGPRAPLGRSDNFPRSVASRLGADPTRAVLDVSGGQALQPLINELCQTIWTGASKVALAFGAEAISTVRHWAGRENSPGFSETVEGRLEDRGFGLQGLVTLEQAKYGLTDVPSQYALVENVRRAGSDRPATSAPARGAPVRALHRSGGTQPARCSASTADRAGSRHPPSCSNRLIAEPYTRYLVARDQVNQGAAVLLTSAGLGRRLGVVEDRWVFLAAFGVPEDEDLPALLAQDHVVGRRACGRSFAAGNRATTTRTRMDELRPRTRPSLERPTSSYRWSATDTGSRSPSTVPRP